MRNLTIDGLLADRAIREAAAAVRPDADLAETVARAAWSVLAEPGDGVAGALVRMHGAPRALELALDEAALLAAGDGVTPRALADAQARWCPRADPRAFADALRGAAEVGARMVMPGDGEWPVLLDDLGAHAPLVLWVRGDATAMAAEPAVAVVGARAATGYGEHVAVELAGDLAASGVAIVSGGAYGIDGAAHRAALGVGGTTVAFLAGGVDRAYPAGHQQLFERIREHGAVVSEVPCGAAPTKWRFLQRNRLIAALGMATVVVEAGWRSGSLNTAGHAAALGRPLGAVPGPVTSAASAGCHRLMREYGAVCVTTAQEVRELWGEEPAAAAAHGDDPDRTRVLDALSGRAQRGVEDLARRTGMSVDRVRSVLGLLALDGSAVRGEVGWRRGG
ncbi:DNA-processing protein DprA [Microbacterium sp. EF45047]|uniref:DNA-processing protein DprA n=1 Tax=Microbacterium sp. EF45047 TaxID=2809708 RepID=UPI00234AD9AC|nr:DNA-processing protein DprA [Microbacterium sp. EF45047]WCM56656.1 DNA-protecting protein DprA [Microbacterium sp. EF45047]